MTDTCVLEGPRGRVRIGQPTSGEEKWLPCGRWRGTRKHYIPGVLFRCMPFIRPAALTLLLLVPLALAQTSIERTALPGTYVEDTGITKVFSAWGSMGNTVLAKDGHVFVAHFENF